MDIGAYLRSKLDDFKNTVSSFVPTVTRQNDGSQRVQFSPQASQTIRNVGNTANTISRAFMQNASPAVSLYNQFNKSSPISNPVDVYKKIKPIPIIGDLVGGIGNSVGDFGNAFSSYATSKAPILSKQGAMEYGNMLGKGAIAGANVLGASRITPGIVAANSAFGGALNAIGSSNPLDSFFQGARQGAKYSPVLAGIGGITNPAIQRVAGNAASLVGGPVSQQLASRFATGLANIPEGMLMRKGQGMDGYGLADARNDFAIGALLGPGGKVAGKGLRSNLYAGETATGFGKAKGKFSALTDKKPRFEISDRQASVKNRVIDNALKQEGTKLVRLGDILNHEGLYKQYPNFKRIKVIFEDTDITKKGSFDPQRFTIRVNSSLKKGEMRSTLLHEVQHAVQKIEGFAQGGNSEMFGLSNEAMRDVSRKIDNIKKYQETLNNMVNDNKNMELNMKLDGFMGTKEEYKKKLIKRIYESSEELKGLREYEPSPIEKMRGYQSLAGEVEARDVQAREALSPEQRRTTQPYASQGIPLNKQVVNFGGQEAASIPAPVVNATKTSRFVAKNKMPEIAFRGQSGETTGGTGIARYGPGLYSTTSKKLAKEFASRNEGGTVVELNSYSLPKNPLQFNTHADYQNWLHYDVQKNSGVKDLKEFRSKYSSDPSSLIRSLGYDGLTIGKGNDMEIVTFKPLEEGISQNAVLDRSNSVLNNFQKATDHIDDFNMKGSAIKSIVDEKLKSINPKSVTPEQLQDLKATRAALNKSLYGPVEDEASRRMAAQMSEIPEVAGFWNDITDSVLNIDKILKSVKSQKGFEIEPNFITSKDKRVKPVMDRRNPYLVKVGDTQFIGNDRKKLDKQVTKFIESQNVTRITAQDGKIKVKPPEEVLRDLQRTARPNESVMQQDVRRLKGIGTSDFEQQMDALGRTFTKEPVSGQKIKVAEPPRGFTGEDTQRVAGIAQANASENKKGFETLFDKWIGQRDVAKTVGYERGAQFKDIPKESGPAVIKFIESPESQAPREIRQYADKLRRSYDELYNNAQQSGIDMGYLKNYITHIWDKPSDEVAQIYKAAKQRFNFANERVLPTYEEGIRLGLKPKYSTPQQIIAEYARKLEETKANVDFFNTARKDGFIVDATIGSREPGFSPLVGPGFPKSSSMAPDGTRVQGFYYAPTNIANQINRLFSPQDYGNLGKAMSVGKSISATIQDVTLSGGAPGTAINAFTTAQVLKEFLAGRFVSPITSLFRSISPKMSNDYFNENIESVKKLQAGNISLSTPLNAEDLVGGLNANGVGGKLKQLWNKSVNDPTFKRFMPMIMINLFKDIESQALKGGVSPEEATAIGIKAVKGFYGVTSSGEMARRNKFVGDVAGTFLFAPKFRESMINFWINSVKSLKNPLALENRANVKFLAGATLTYAAMNLMQKELTGQYLWDNPDNKKDKLLIPLGNGSDIVLGVPFLSSIATVPRNIASAGIKVAKGDLKGAIVDSARAFGSTTAKLPAELIANEDYFGNQIYAENDDTFEKYKKMGGYALKSLSHPYVRAALSINDNVQDASNAKPGYQIASETMELPIRFYKQKSIDSSYYYDAVKKSLETLSQDEMSAYKALPSNSKVLESDDPSKAIVNANIMLAYPKVFEAKRMAQLQTAKGDMTKIDPLYLADDASVKKYLRYQTLPPGSSDKKDMYAANPEIGDLAKARSEYFAANPLPGGNTSNKPMPSQYVQQQMDAKNWKDPEVRSYLDANTAYNNDQRAKLGLPPLAGFSSFPKKASGPKKIKVAKLKIPKVKLKKYKMAKLKVKKAKLTKIKALKVPKYKAPKFS